MRKRILCGAVLSALLMMTACGPKPDVVGADVSTDPQAATPTATTPAVTASPTPSTATTTPGQVSPSPDATSAASPAATVTEDPNIETVGDMKNFVDANTLIVRGRFTKLKEKDFNSIRDADDSSKGHKNAFIHHNLYEFEVAECLKGSIKKGTTIVVALETESKMNMPSSKLYKCERYIEPTFGEDVIQALAEYDKEFKLYYTSSFNEPQRFSVDAGEKMFVLSNDKKTAETFEKGLGKPGAAGIPLKMLTDITGKGK